MSWFERHIDRWMEAWALGELTSSQATRLLRHAHTCERCGHLYEQWVRAHRMFESGDVNVPTPAESLARRASGLEAALAAAAPAPVRVRWPALVALLGTMAAAAFGVLLVVGRLTPSNVQEWQPRGVGMPSPSAAMRLFCATPGQPLRELVGPEDTCPPGAKLAFAAGAESPLSHVAVLAYKEVQPDSGGQMVVAEASMEPRPQTVRPPPPEDEGPWRHKGGPFPVGGRPGQEAPLELTIQLPSSPGKKVVVEAAFASGPEAALQDLLAPRAQVKGVMRRQLVLLQEDR
ncbi:hypothetical protein BO221_07250 [Archangium sp. Cb G35]|uniref:anti-sigma factor family protein n=1 Tax=Archangium sp. Cb G35 TaxID=1920190 RepID=UPI00093601D5|nr:zf-HC2 domain-containing protein [Archangium sp. Cb G35]OJT25648.1 hypothetical protein BO221_07250 [Archangium sp. Cb G35]